MKNNQCLKIPHNCYLILTSKCNMRCKHCYGSYGNNIPEKELTGDEWIKVIEDLTKNGVFFVNISGGEPTTHPDFIKIIDALIKNEIYFMLTTNGVFSDKILKSILKAKDYILGIQISLDGADWITHGYLRKNIHGKSEKILFDKAVNSIKAFTSANIRTSIATCIHPKNIHKIDELKNLVITLKPCNWSLSTISISGRAKENSEIFVSESKLSNKYWLDLQKECANNNIMVNFIDMPNLIKETSSSMIYYECPAAKWFCEINSNGITTPCPLARVNPPKKAIKWDNITKKTLKEIWNGKPFNIFRSYQNRGCDGCKAKSKCDRCPPQSIQWFDDPLMPTPYCIENGEQLGLCRLEELKRKLEEAKQKNNREEYGIKENV